jgi:hypothetical protein
MRKNIFDNHVWFAELRVVYNEQIGNIIAVERNRLASSKPIMTKSKLVSHLKTNVALAL